MISKKLFTATMAVGLLSILIMSTAAKAAGVIFNSISSPPSGFSDAITSVGPLGSSFMGDGFRLNRVELLLVGGNTPTGSITVDLYSDNGGPNPGPGAPIANIGTLVDTSLVANSLNLVNFSSFAPIHLDDGTRYWINVASSDSSAAWSYSFDTSGIGVAGQYFSNSFGVTSNEFGPYQMKLTTVPEPSTLALLSLGVAGLGFSKRRKLS